MNIVHVKDFFHPEAGYQINILSKYMRKDGHKVTIVTSEMDKIPENLTSFFTKNNIHERDLKYEKETGVKIIRVKLIGFISGRAVFSNKIFDVVNDLNPDILYVHGNDTLTGIRYLLRYKKLKYAMVMDSHMLEMASINKFSRYFKVFYKLLITPIIVKNKILIIRTQDDNYVEKHLGIPLSLSPWISVGSDTKLFKRSLKTRKKMREKLSIVDEDFVIVYTGKLDEAKGGEFLAKSFLKKINANKTVILMIVGDTVGEYGKKVDECLLNSENRIIRIPTQKYIDLPKYYQMADLSIFPKQSSLSFYDAQACGLPVVFENNNINISRIKNNNAFIFKASDLDDFRSKITMCANLNQKDYLEISSNSIEFVRENYDYEQLYKKYMEILEHEVKRFKSSTCIEV